MPTTVFQGIQATCTWEGKTMTTDDVATVRGEIVDRVLDLTHERSVIDNLRLASAKVSGDWLNDFLEEAVSHEVESWQVGEAIAEVVLQNSHGVVFPWNNRRDERNPKASLPGADLVGVSEEPGGSRIVFGEVKSSAELKSPPGVVSGRDGLDQQLERLIDNQDLQFSLIKWLGARVGDDKTRAIFNKALASFVETNSASTRVIGVLVRDTEPDENDVSRRGRALGDRVVAPGSVELYVLYVPMPMDDWADWAAA